MYEYVLTVHIYVGVSNLRNSMTTNATIIEWNSANSPSDCGPVLYYTVIAVSLVNATDVNNMEQVEGTRAVFSNLKNGTNYNISVAGVNRVGTGPVSTIIVTGNAEGK